MAIDQTRAHDLYHKILRIRLAEEEIAKRYSQQEMRCPVHLSVGQEATPVGVCETLKPDDVMFGTHRSHAHYLAKNGSLNALIGELYGRVTGCSRGQGGSMHLIDVKQGFIAATSIVAGTVPVGVGAALGFKLKKQARVSVICIGDTVLEEGVFHEAANFASLKKLPVIFMCENNGYSCYSPLKNRQPERPLTDVAKAHGMAHFNIDGNDVYEIYEKMPAIVSSVRSGNGPAFVEFPTFRYLEHCGPANDDALNYRTKEEIIHWTAQDPIAKARKKLTDMGYWTEQFGSECKAKIDAEVALSFESAIKAPYPSQSELGAYIYAK